MSTPSPPPDNIAGSRPPRKSVKDLDSSGARKSLSSPGGNNIKSPRVPSLKRESLVSPKSKSLQNQMTCPTNTDHILHVLAPSEVAGIRCEVCKIHGSAAAGMRRRLYQCEDCVKTVTLCKQCLLLKYSCNDETAERKGIATTQGQERETIEESEETEREQQLTHEARARQHGEELAKAAAQFEKQEHQSRSKIFAEEQQSFLPISDLIDSQATAHQSGVRDAQGVFNLIIQTERKSLKTPVFIKAVNESLGGYKDVRLVGLATLSFSEATINTLKMEAKAKNTSALRRERLYVTPFPYTSQDDAKLHRAAVIYQTIIQMWRDKPGDILDELVQNLVTPEEEDSNALCPSTAKFNILYGVSEAMREKCSRRFPTRTGLASLVLALYSGEGPDIDRVLGFKDAPEPRVVETSDGQWKDYHEQIADTRNPTLRDIFDRTLHILYNGSEGEEGYQSAWKSMRRWVKVFSAIAGAVSRKGIEGNPELTHASKHVKMGLVNYYKNLTTGSGILWPSPLRASKSNCEVEQFASCDGDGVCVVIKSIHESIPILDLSFYPREEEVLLPPFSNFRVDRVKEGSAGTVVHVSWRPLPELAELTTSFYKEAMEATEKAQNRMRQIVTTINSEITMRSNVNAENIRKTFWENTSVGGVEVLSVLAGEVVVAERNSSLIPELLESQINDRETPPEMTPAIKLFNAIANEVLEELAEIHSAAPADPFDSKLCEVYEGSALLIAAASPVFSEGPGLDHIITLLHPSPAVMWHHRDLSPTQLISLPNPKGYTPLHIAANKGFVAMCKEFLDAGMEVHHRDFEGRAALMVAVEKQEFSQDSIGLDIIARLCAPQVVNDTDETENEYTAVMKAAKAGNLGTVEVLVAKGADLDKKGTAGETALHLAVDAAEGAILSALIEAGADINVTWEEKTMLQRVAEDAAWLHKGSYASIVRKLSTPTALPWLTTQDASTKRSPLHQACLQGRAHLVDAMIESGAPLDTLDQLGKTPLQLVIEYGDGDQKTVVKSLLAAGPESNLTKKQQEEMRRILGGTKARMSRKQSSKASIPARRRSHSSD